jgi:hypothetical protein
LSISGNISLDLQVVWRVRKECNSISCLEKLFISKSI